MNRFAVVAKASKQAVAEARPSEEEAAPKTSKRGTKRTSESAQKKAKTNVNPTRETGTEEETMEEPQKRKRAHRDKPGGSWGKGLERKAEKGMYDDVL